MGEFLSFLSFWNEEFVEKWLVFLLVFSDIDFCFVIYVGWENVLLFIDGFGYMKVVLDVLIVMKVNFGSGG